MQHSITKCSCGQTAVFPLLITPTCVGFANCLHIQYCILVQHSPDDLPEDLEPSEIKPAQLEGQASSMHEDGLHQRGSKGTEVQHTPHAGHHTELALCLLWQSIEVLLLGLYGKV